MTWNQNKIDDTPFIASETRGQQPSPIPRFRVKRYRYHYYQIFVRREMMELHNDDREAFLTAVQTLVPSIPTKRKDRIFTSC